LKSCRSLYHAKRLFHEVADIGFLFR
jgi:hypothetical protein